MKTPAELEEEIDDLHNEIEALEDEIKALENERDEYEARIYTSCNRKTLVAKFSSAEEALICLPALSYALGRSLFLESGTSLGIRNPIPSRCLIMENGITYRR